ncbi:gamma-glutamylcyclotransferase-like [Melitaea cinxia]|uniref:gamma-glutamylcyclotransferase-like n=1 Tax=Melitaea cinxia TaxID=113334 RepID=UPI001E272FE9|nr:gamma-glutamylcyclotransferase-like [Melitaea cinxia]
MSLSHFTVLCFVVCQCYSVEIWDNKDKFLYFGYGSNLLSKRIHINNPTATFFAPAKLSGYRLDFNTFSPFWNGAAATIVEDPDSHVWGALWTLDNADMKSLDKQEGVDTNFYYAKNVTVFTSRGQAYLARTYIETINPTKVPSYEIPPERQPSNTYMQVIIIGAYESSLPAEYIVFLKTFPTNGKLGSKEVRESLGYPFNVS